MKVNLKFFWTAKTLGKVDPPCNVLTTKEEIQSKLQQNKLINIKKHNVQIYVKYITRM